VSKRSVLAGRLGTTYYNPAAAGDPAEEQIMRTSRNYARSGWLLAAVCGLAFLVNGCDATLKATIENGVITTSQSLFGSVLNALIQLGQEQYNATHTTNTTSG
jgi:hypothetical protein